MWTKQTIPKPWRRAWGNGNPQRELCLRHQSILQINLLNVEGKVFFSIVAKRMTTYLKQNNFIDTTVQKAGIPGFLGCLEHTSMIWDQIQNAKR